MQEKPLQKRSKKTSLGEAKPPNALPPKVISPLPSSIPDNTSNLVTIACISRPQGLKGEVIARLETDFPERFDKLKNVFLVFPNGKIEETFLENHWFHKGQVVLKFSLISDRNDAETLRNALVKIPESDLIELPKDHYYEFDLVGCQITTINGLEIGKVQELMYTGPAPLLIVRGTKEYLIPLAEEICYEINIKEKKILINPPEGLLEL